MKRKFQKHVKFQTMNKIKVGIAILAIILTAGISRATQNSARFTSCYPPGSGTLQEVSCPNPVSTICCYSGANNTGTTFFKS